MSPSEIEKIKLLAGTLDRACTSCFTVGIATPIAGFVYNFANFGTIDPWRLGLGISAWMIVAVALHYMARRVLNGLDK